jgi:hypothetical protein
LLGEDYRIKNPCKLADVMPVCACHDQRQRDATAVHQGMPFASIFFPDAVGFGPTASGP